MNREGVASRERSLIGHYFRTLLKRDPDDAERRAWEARSQEAIEASPATTDAWHAITKAFFASDAYRALDRTDTEFVRDLYATFLDRAPDEGGLAWWPEQIAGGMAREAVLAQFMFSPECAFDLVRARNGFMLNRRVRAAATRPEAGSRITPVLPDLAPMEIRVVRDGSVPRRLNIAIPTLLKENFSGGPNTALALGQVLADRGIPVNFVSTDAGMERDPQTLRDHLALLTGIGSPRAAVTFTAGDDPARPVTIGREDVMLGTAWWTVQKFKHCLGHLRTPRFVYLVQEYEPGLYPFSTKYALAAETYALDHLPIYNHRFLHGYFKANRIGAFARGDAGDGGAWFDPVLDPAHFFYDEALRKEQEGRSLLFYGRPTYAMRNLYEMGCAALATLADEGAFEQGWTLHSMGEHVGDVYLPRDKVLAQMPWLGFDDYARRMRSCDVLLSLMLSPHPSYPPLEGAASGALVVTSEFANKDAAALGAISPNIVAVRPTVEGVVAGIRQAIERTTDTAARRAASRLSLPADWKTALAGAADRICAFWERA